ncbi:MAG: DUF561 domain-containing protein [Lachnospiraceae bacterium]|nr:DUF561 domain-containing protein [Lachnospiraceae bacterium]
MRIDKKLGIRYPLIQGGMANIATGEFAAAVSNAGALGLIGAGGWTVEQVEEQIAICKKLTDKPFGVNLMLMNPQAPQIAELLANEKIAVITTGAGNPAPYMEKWKANGSLVMPVMTSTLIAKRLEAAGADYIIAEGTESGGHVGEMTTMAMIPQMVDALNIPVIAAGGIADGRQVLAAFALGASGVQVGTCLLASKECPIHENYKEAVIKAKDNDTIVTGRIGGTPVRILKNQMAREYVKREKEGADKMELENFTLGSLRRAVFDGDTKTGSLMAGQVAGQVKEIRTLAEIIEDMFAGAKKTYELLGNEQF